MKWPMTSSCNREKKMKTNQLGHNSKYLLIINPILISKTTIDKTCPVALNTTIDSGLDLINPTTVIGVTQDRSGTRF